MEAEDEKEGEGRRGRKEKRRGRKEEEEDKDKNRESSANDAPPSPHAFPSKKLGNNMTPIKGRLEKNTTPTDRVPKKLIQRLQRNPSKDSRTSIPCELHSPTMKSRIFKSAGYRGNIIAIYKEAKVFENASNRSKFSMNQH